MLTADDIELTVEEAIVIELASFDPRTPHRKELYKASGRVLREHAKQIAERVAQLPPSKKKEKKSKAAQLREIAGELEAGGVKSVILHFASDSMPPFTVPEDVFIGMLQIVAGSALTDPDLDKRAHDSATKLLHILREW